jgi:hypothetical protein
VRRHRNHGGLGPDFAVTVGSEHNLIIDIGYGGGEDTIR